MAIRDKSQSPSTDFNMKFKLGAAAGLFRPQSQYQKWHAFAMLAEQSAPPARRAARKAVNKIRKWSRPALCAYMDRCLARPALQRAKAIDDVGVL